MLKKALFLTPIFLASTLFAMEEGKVSAISSTKKGLYSTIVVRTWAGHEFDINNISPSTTIGCVKKKLESQK